jgi:hypothetical protein
MDLEESSDSNKEDVESDSDEGTTAIKVDFKRNKKD